MARVSNWCCVFGCFSVIIIAVIASPSLNLNAPSNSQILKNLGFSRIKLSQNHHRKRLAVESRHHQSSDDSHMYVIKLPPNPYYYTHNRPEKNRVESNKKVPVGFKSNGKPAKVYHWNIPVMKKLALSTQSRSRLDDSLVVKAHQIKKLPIKNYQAFANEVHDKISNVNKKYQKSPTYYAPAKPKKGSVYKFLGGNGKPQSFYVIEKSKKAHYHRLLP